MAEQKRYSLIAKVRKLTPTGFENLSYDLVVLSGLRNAVWRTPGADGGRDIEGDFNSTDLSEFVTVERWYVECKHYKKSVDWPTVFEKIAYADNHAADFLLLITTSTLSPRCKEELSKRELAKHRPRVRVWDAPVLENMVARHALLLHKYGLGERKRLDAIVSALPVLTVLSKTVQAAYGTVALRGTPEPALEYSAALIDLLAARIDSFQEPGQRVKRFVHGRDLYSWCRLEGDRTGLERFDSYGLRAVLAAVRFFVPAAKLVLRGVGAGQLEIIPTDEQVWRNSKVVRDALVMIGIWSNFETQISKAGIRIALRLEA